MSGSVVCVGVFDGVHRGHRSLIAQARVEADRAGLPLVAVTFWPHPAAVLRPADAPRSLATIEGRVELLRAAGAEEVDVLRFDADLAGLTAEEFVQRELLDRLGARVVVVGENFVFGAHAAGNVEVLRELGSALGFGVLAVPLEADSEPWSSTRVRRHLSAGEITEANRILGRAYVVTGEVVHGDHRGRELGIPTANLRPEGNPVIPADGVYAGWLDAGGERMPAAISIGPNPQFAGEDHRIEAYAIDRTGLDLYGQQVRVEFIDYLRPQAVFPDVEGFMAQVWADVAAARDIIG
jgi:riboflavin kinase/FMN adenylyltransferase